MILQEETQVEPKLDIVRDKYAFIVALLAAILALGVFKEGLANAHMSIGNWTPDLLALSIWIMGALFLSVYFFALTYAMKGTRLDGTKVVSASITVGNICYATGILMPILFLISWGVTEGVQVVLPLISNVFRLSDRVAYLLNYAGIISGAIGLVFASISNALHKNKLRAEEEKRMFDVMRVKMLEAVKLLYKQKMYALTVIECCRLLEFALIQSLTNRGHTFLSAPLSMRTLADEALSLGILNKSDLKRLLRISKIRNEVVHGSSDSSKSEADYVRIESQTIINKLDVGAET